MAQKQRKRPVKVPAQAPVPVAEHEIEAYDDDVAEHAVAGLRAAFVVLSLDTLGLLGGGIYLATRSTGHDASNQKAAVTQAVFLLFTAVIFGLLARGALPHRPKLWIRTPALIFELIFIPVSIGLFQSDRPEIGGPLLVSALVAITGLILGFRRGNSAT